MDQLMGQYIQLTFFFGLVMRFSVLFDRIYEGHVPFLVTSDLDIIQEVFIKQFSSVPIRKVILFL